MSYVLDSYTIPALVTAPRSKLTPCESYGRHCQDSEFRRPFVTQQMIIYIVICKNFTRKQSNLCRTRKKFLDQFLVRFCKNLTIFGSILIKFLAVNKLPTFQGRPYSAWVLVTRWIQKCPLHPQRSWQWKMLSNILALFL